MFINFSNSELAYFCLFIVAFTFLVKQALLKQKQLIHFLFAIFCASLCMMTIQKISASSIGIYHYLIGFATCATCNVTWLISRVLFRTQNPISKRHIFVASFIALLIVANQTWHMLNDMGVTTTLLMSQIKQGLNEVTSMLSSTILLLSFWEALRGFSSKSKAEKVQSSVFAGAFFAAVFLSTFVATVFISAENQAMASPWIVFIAASIIMIAIQSVLVLQNKQARSNHIIRDTVNCLAQEKLATSPRATHDITLEDNKLIEDIDALINQQKIFLQSNIKVMDFAKALNTPEYKVSRVIRAHFNSPNFNHFINRYRVEHAKQLLRSRDAKDWSILVIGLECGFSSLVSFNRAFKNLSGNKPNQYRTQVSIE